MKIEWDKSISLGVPHLDNDHKQLLDIFNYLDAHKQDDVKSEAISLIMEQIREFASGHFRREEEYMQSIDYPSFEAHKAAHKYFKEKTASLCLDIMHGKQTAPNDIYLFLYSWVIDHMLREDKLIKAFNEARQACENNMR